MPKNREATATVGFSPELAAATGKVDFQMTNDYMFRAVLQSNNLALKGFISALLHIPPEKILSVEITNPIILGDSCEDKEFRLDINVAVNDGTLINLEMQVISYSDWTERSLVYLCRNFDNISRGQEYSQLKPVLHIGILDFTLFKDNPEFYAHYQFMNARTHKIYSDKLALNVLDLTHTELATAEDRKWGIDYWARLFKSTTWEEIKMVAQNNEYLTEASNSIFRMNADELTRKRCLDREEYYRDVNRWQRKIEEQEIIIGKKDAIIDKQRNALREKESALQEKESALIEQSRIIAELREQLNKG